MLILASISGIQDFLFDVRESGGKQARSLRFRSFRIQLLAEAVALRLLDAMELPPDRLLFSAAAKVCIDARNLPDTALDRAREVTADVERRLLEETHGRLRLAVAFAESGDNFAEAFEQAGRALAARKVQPYKLLGAADGTTWPAGCLTLATSWNPDSEAERDADVGTRLTKAKWVSIRRGRGAGTEKGIDLVGLTATLDAGPPQSTDDLLSISNLERPDEPPRGLPKAKFHPRRLARSVPRDNGGNPIEFLDLAACSRGSAMLGVLKADVDSLGPALGALLRSRGADGAPALKKFSAALDEFFSETMGAEMRREPWNRMYTVFAGGDDILVVGPWDTVLDFAGHLHGLFNSAFGGGANRAPAATPLTISAGVAIIKPRYPIHLGAQQADDLLGAAKSAPAPGATAPKDQCAALGGLWKWADHERIIGDGKQLADWVDAGAIQRGWLQTLLELALLRRGEGGPEYAGVHPAIATSRLAYHVSRNWKTYSTARDDRQQSANAAREWIDAVLEDFDIDDPGAQRGRGRYLPSIVRYSLLATRSGSVEERP